MSKRIAEQYRNVHVPAHNLHMVAELARVYVPFGQAEGAVDWVQA